MHVRAFAFAAVLTLAVAPPVSAQIMEMNGTWEMIPDKCLGSWPDQETLVFKSVEGIQRYAATWIDDDRTLISVGRSATGEVRWVRVFEKQ